MMGLPFGVFLIVVVGQGVALASAAAKPSKAADCRVLEPEVDDSHDLHAIDNFGTFVRHLLVQGRFDALDCMADTARANKTKFSGGFWKLHSLYAGLSEPVDGKAHATEADWNDHIARINSWVVANPNSVTARIVLAKVYVGYAWMARGEGFADTVTDNGWRLINERTQLAEDALKAAYKVPAKCPEWYLAAQQVLQLQGTDKEKLAALLDEAIAFEPTYQYFYRMHANLLAAKWFGKEGDEEKFAEQAADRLGGTQGDILYFEIASHIICPCNDQVDLKLMSWPRMQKGFKVLTEREGASLTNLNLLAYVATKEADATVANESFDHIGENWDPTLWKTRSFFDQNKKWAAEGVASMAWEKSIRDAAEADMRTPEGMEMKKKFDETFAPRLQKCVASSDPTKRNPFVLWVLVGEKGDTLQIMAYPSSNIADCMVRQGPEKLLPPSHAPFWLKIEIDPGNMSLALLR